MAAVFWLLVLGAGVVTGQPWAYLILVVLVICARLANTSQSAAPRPAKALQAAAPAPVAQDLAADIRQLKRHWRAEAHKAWDEEFNRLAAG
jgi:hypothetical protein